MLPGEDQWSSGFSRLNCLDKASYADAWVAYYIMPHPDNTYNSVLITNLTLILQTGK